MRSRIKSFVSRGSACWAANPTGPMASSSRQQQIVRIMAVNVRRPTVREDVWRKIAVGRSFCDGKHQKVSYLRHRDGHFRTQLPNREALPTLHRYRRTCPSALFLTLERPAQQRRANGEARPD